MGIEEYFMSKDKAKSGHCDYCLMNDAPEVLDVQITYYNHKQKISIWEMEIYPGKNETNMALCEKN